MTMLSVNTRSSKVKIVTIIVFLIIVFTSFITFVPTTTHACDCAPLPVGEQLAYSTAVFSGKVLNIEDVNKLNLTKSTADPIVVTISVNETWKGIDETGVFNASFVIIALALAIVIVFWIWWRRHSKRVT